MQLRLSVVPVLIALLAAPPGAFGQESDGDGTGGVRIVRTLPETGENTTRATWTPPRPTPAQTVLRAEPPTELSGRIAVGSTGGIDPEGEQQFGMAADSRLSLVQPLGADAAMEIEGEAKRHVSIRETRELYGGGIAVTAERADVGIDGQYELSETGGEEVDEDVEGMSVGLETELAYLETLPITLGGSYAYDSAHENDTRVESRQELRGEVAAEGTVGESDVSASVRAEQLTDDEDDLEITNTGAALATTLPLSDVFSLRPDIAASYSDTVYTEESSSLETVSLDARLGFLFPLSEELLLRVVPGSVNRWNSQAGEVPEGEEADDYELTLSALARAEYRDEEGPSADGEYEVLDVVEGGRTHRATTSVGWDAPEEEAATLDSVSARGRLVFVNDDEDSARTRDHSWRASVRLIPVTSMRIESGYDGSYLTEDTETLTHTGSLDYSHAPSDAFSYGGDAELTATLRFEEPDELEQTYGSEAEIAPRIGGGRPALSVREELEIIRGAGPDEYLSTLSPGLSVPLGRPVQLRYGFAWEWYRTDRRVENSYSHTAGASVGVGSLSSTTEYRYSHGDRRERHDLSSGIQVRFGDGYSVEGDVEWSRYRGNGELRTPVVSTILLARSF
jgi:hypothetical protein